MLPLDFETDREMLDAALGVIGLVEPPDAKLLWIRDTLALEELECSAAYLDEVRQRPETGNPHAAAGAAAGRRGQPADDVRGTLVGRIFNPSRNQGADYKSALQSRAGRVLMLQNWASLPAAVLPYCLLFFPP